MTIRGATWTAPMVVLIGCGGGAGSPGTSSANTPSAFCRAYDMHRAKAEFACAGGQGEPPDVAADNCDVLDGALAHGSISFDPSAAADCLVEVDKGLGGACSTESACVSRVIKGLLPEGAPCTHWMECPKGGGCGQSDGMSCEQHVCSGAFAVLGEPCGGATDPPCAVGLQCQSGAGAATGTCALAVDAVRCLNRVTDCRYYTEFCGLDGVCAPRRPIGASCADDVDSCVILAWCDSTTHLCAPAGAKGQPCGEEGLCWNGACFPANTPSNNVCSAPLMAGAPCTYSYHCASGVCTAGACASCP
jgi:hypothetical protein